MIKALLAAYPDAAKEKDEVRCGRGRRVLCPLLSLLTCVCCRVQGGNLPLHLAARYNESEAVIKALLAAYPGAAKAKTVVRCGRGRRVLCPLLSHSSHMRSMPSPPPLFSLAAAQDGRLPKDLAKTDAIKALLSVPDLASAPKFDVNTGQPIPKFDPQTGKQNWA